MYGLIRMLGNQLKFGPQEQSQRGKNVPLNAINLSGKVLPWRLIALRETDLSGLCIKAPCDFHKEQDFVRERGNQSTSACLLF